MVIDNFTQIETNVRNSFRLAKEDILKLRRNVIDIQDKQRIIIELLNGLGVRKLKSKITTRKIVRFVASKLGTKFHLNNCPFAQNINKKNRVIFRSKGKALDAKYKSCNCIK